MMDIKEVKKQVQKVGMFLELSSFGVFSLFLILALFNLRFGDAIAAFLLCFASGYMFRTYISVRKTNKSIDKDDGLINKVLEDNVKQRNR